MEKKNIYFANSEIECNSNGVFYKKGKQTATLCNTPLRFLYMLKRDDTDKTERILQIGNDDNPKIMVLTNDEVSSVKEFKKRLNNEDIQYRGNQITLDAFLSAQNETKPLQRVLKVPILGYNTKANSFFFANAVCHNETIIYPNDFGIVEIEGECYQMPYAKTKYFDPIQTEASKWCVYEDNDKMSFADFANLLHFAYGDKSLLPLCFAVMTVFRHVVFANCGFVPLMYLQGQASSGKSKMGDIITNLFGNPHENIDLKQKNTKEGLSKKHSLVSGVAICSNEFINKEDFVDTYQAFWNCTGAVKGCLDDYDTKTRPIVSTSFMTSNYTPNDMPFFTRVVYMNLPIQDDISTLAQRKVIVDKTLQVNLTCVLKELLTNNQLIVNEFKRHYDYYNQVISQSLIKEYDKLESRYVDNAAALITPLAILIEKGKLTLEHVKNVDCLLNAVISNVKIQIETIKTDGDIAEFWRQLEEMFRCNQISRDTHIKFDNEILAINWHAVYDVFATRNGIRTPTEKRKEKQRYADLLRNSAAFRPSKDKNGSPEPFHKRRFDAYSGTDDESETGTKVKQGLDFNYATLQKDFGVDFGSF